MAAYSEYLRWVAYMAAAVGAWRFLPLAIVRLVAALTSNEMRHKQCMEVLRLARRDAADIPSYVFESSAANQSHRRKPSTRTKPLDQRTAHSP